MDYETLRRLLKGGRTWLVYGLAVFIFFGRVCAFIFF